MNKNDNNARLLYMLSGYKIANAPDGHFDVLKDKDGQGLGGFDRSHTPVQVTPDGYEFMYQEVLVTYLYNYNYDATSHSPYIEGIGDGKFDHGGNITRAQVSIIIYRLDGEPSYNTDASFPDVKKGTWYYDAVMYLQSTGVVEGYDNGNFGPADSITRAQMASILARYNNLDISAPGNSSFSDVPSGKWYTNAVSVLGDKGWITGYPDGRFGPDDNITRAQAVTMINRMLNRSNPDIPADIINPFSDLPTDHWAYKEILEASVSHDTSWHGGAGNSRTPAYKVNENFIDMAGEKTFDTKTYTTAQPVVPAPKSSNISNDYTYIGYEATVNNIYQKAGAGLDTYHGAVGWYAYGAYRTASAGKGLPKGSVAPGDRIEYYVGIENNTDLAKDCDNYKISFEECGVLPNGAAKNARLELKLDTYYDFPTTADKKPANYNGNRVKLVSVDGDYESYDYDEYNKIVTVYFGDIALGGKRVFTVTLEVLPMTGVSESIFKFSPAYYTDNLGASSHLTPTISVGGAPSNNIYHARFSEYDDFGITNGLGNYSFNIVG